MYPAGKTREELNSDALCGGSVAAIRKSLQRLEKRGLIWVSGTRKTEKGGRVVNVYQAVVAKDLEPSSRGEVVEECPVSQTTSGSKASAMGHSPTSEPGCPTSDSVVDSTGTLPTKSEPCPIADPLLCNQSGQVDTSETYPHAREERSADEIAALVEDARSFWS